MTHRTEWIRFRVISQQRCYNEIYLILWHNIQLHYRKIIFICVIGKVLTRVILNGTVPFGITLYHLVHTNGYNIWLCMQTIKKINSQMMKLYIFRVFKCISSEIETEIWQKMAEININLTTIFGPLMRFCRFFAMCQQCSECDEH